MPRYRIFCTDLDGTLLTTDKRLTPRVVDAVRRCLAAGVEVVMCTARPPRSARPFYDELGLDAPLIAYNGALVVRPRSGETLFHRAIQPDVGARLLDAVLEVDPEMVISFEKADKWFTDERGTREIVTDTAAAGFRPDVVCSLAECAATPSTKMLVSKDAPTLRQVEAALAERFGPRLSVTKCDDYLLQIAAAGVSKASALRATLLDGSLGPADMAAIGDAANDVDMIELAGLGMAVANADHAAKAAAQVVAPANDADGVAVAIEQYVL